MGLIFNGNGDVIKAVDGSLTVEGLDIGGSTNIEAGIGTFSGNLNVGGVLTYEDVKNVDSVGIITARDGIRVTGGNVGINEATPLARLHVKNGESSATGYAHDTIVVEDSDHAYLTFLTGTSGGAGINFGDSGSAQRGVIEYSQNDDYMRFITAQVERLRCDSDGVKVHNGRFYSAGTFAYIASSSTSNSTLTLKKSASGADAIDYLQLRDNSNALKLKIGGDGIIYTPDVLASHEGDTDTKIRFPAADTIAAETGGSERLRIASTGNVSIGTQNVTEGKLQVAGDITAGYHHGSGMYGLLAKRKFQGGDALGGYAIRYASGYESPWIVGYNAGSSYDNQITFGSMTTSDRSLETGVTKRMVIDMETGRVGVGTDDPDKKLEVWDATQGVIRIRGGGGGSDSNRKADLSLFASGAREYVVRADASDAAFKIVDVTGSNAERLCIASNGKVGIRTDNPTTTLHVRGNGVITQQTGGTITNGIFLDPGDTGQGNRPDIILKGAGSAGLSQQAMQVYYDNGSTKAYHLRYDGGAYFGGSVGIGEDAPDQKLHLYESSTSSQCYLHIQNNRSRNAAIKFTTTQGSWFVGQGIGVDADRFSVYDSAERFTINSSGDAEVTTGYLQAQDLQIGLAGDRYPIIQRAVASSGSQSLSITGGSGYSTNTGSNHTPTDAKQGALISLSAGNPTSDTFGGGIRYYANGHTSPNNPGSGNQHVFYTRSGVNTYAERIRIEEGGRILINTPGTSINAHEQCDDVVIGNVSHGHDTGVTIVSNTSYNGWIAFSDGTTNSTRRKGAIVYHHPSDTMYLRTNNNQTGLQISGDGEVTKPKNPAFSVRHSVNQSVTSTGWTQKSFNSEIFDIGGNFASNAFTAPVDGIYAFGWNQRFDTGNEQYFRIALRVNDSTGSTYQHGHAIYRDVDGFHYVTLNLTSLVQLDSGDVVKAYVFSNTDSSYSLQNESIFWGYLVS